MNRLVLLAVFITCLTISASASLVIYGIEDPRQTASQMFTLDLSTNTLTLVGPEYDDADIEGIAWLGTSIIGHTGENESPHEYIDLSFTMGTYSVISPADTGPGDPEFTGLSSDTFGTVWGFVEDLGFGTVGVLGSFNLMYASTLPIEGVALTPDGNTLYAIRENGVLYEMSTATGIITQIAALESSDNIENLEMLSETQVAFLTSEGGGVALNIYDVGNQELTATFLPGIDLDDIESFVFADGEVQASETSWGKVKSLY
jgi:hypothetical protein